MSTFLTCEFIYNAGAGDVHFIPTYPPTKKQPDAGGLAAVRHDSITSSGIKQSVLERIDTLAEFSFPFCPLSDMAGWEAFMSFALGGGVFAYRPNSADNTVWYEYTLESMDWVPKWVSYKQFSISFQARLWVGSTVESGS